MRRSGKKMKRFQITWWACLKISIEWCKYKIQSILCILLSVKKMYLGQNTDFPRSYVAFNLLYFFHRFFSHLWIVITWTPYVQSEYEHQLMNAVRKLKEKFIDILFQLHWPHDTFHFDEWFLRWFIIIIVWCWFEESKCVHLKIEIDSLWIDSNLKIRRLNEEEIQKIILFQRCVQHALTKNKKNYENTRTLRSGKQ